MQLLLCAATEAEIGPTLSYLKNHPRHDVEVLITGVGMMAAAFRITEKIAAQPYRLVLQAGVCGSLNINLALTETVAVQFETIGDLGVAENGKFSSLFDLQLAGANEPPWVQKRLTNPHNILSKCGVPAVGGVTVNEISTRPQRIGYYHEVLGADIETMEGAALHYVCLARQVPFLQLRAVSNFIGERDKKKWNLNGAIEQLNRQVLHTLETI